MPSINSARYAHRIIQTESHEIPSFLRKVHRLDPPHYYSVMTGEVGALGLEIRNGGFRSHKIGTT